MRIMLILSDIMIPSVIAAIIIYGLYKRTNVYDAFTEGAMEGLKTILKILPTLIGLMVAVGILRGSSALDLLADVIKPLLEPIGFPADVVPLTLLRLVSSSASTGLLLDIFKQHGPDSFTGRLVSVMMSCTETVFYTMSVYFLSVNITKTRYTLSGALFANVAGIIASFLITVYTFG